MWAVRVKLKGKMAKKFIRNTIRNILDILLDDIFECLDISWFISFKIWFTIKAIVLWSLGAVKKYFFSKTKMVGVIINHLKDM